MKLAKFFPALFGHQPDVVPQVPPPSTAPKPRLRRGIYMLPTLFTLGNMALGFYSLIKSSAQEFGVAATSIIVAHVLDVLDGRVARLTRTESKFGVEIDSLSDWISFGIAPAFMMYELVLKNNRLWGFPIALLFVICGALRLARFNLKAHLGEVKSTDFVGLPIPAAGGMLAIFTLLYEILEIGKPVRTLKVVMLQVPTFYEMVPAIMLLLSLLMVSEVRYSSFKQINLLRPRTMRALVLTLLVLLMIYVYPQNMIFIFYISYITWGLVEYFWRMPRKEKGETTAGYQRETYGK